MCSDDCIADVEFVDRAWEQAGGALGFTKYALSRVAPPAQQGIAHISGLLCARRAADCKTPARSPRIPFASCAVVVAMDFLKSAVASAISKGPAFGYSFGDRVDIDESVWTLYNGTKRVWPGLSAAHGLMS